MRRKKYRGAVRSRRDTHACKQCAERIVRASKRAITRVGLSSSSRNSHNHKSHCVRIVLCPPGWTASSTPSTLPLPIQSPSPRPPTNPPPSQNLHSNREHLCRNNTYLPRSIMHIRPSPGKRPPCRAEHIPASAHQRLTTPTLPFKFPVNLAESNPRSRKTLLVYARYRIGARRRGVGEGFASPRSGKCTIYLVVGVRGA